MLGIAHVKYYSHRTMCYTGTRGTMLNAKVVGCLILGPSAAMQSEQMVRDLHFHAVVCVVTSKPLLSEFTPIHGTVFRFAPGHRGVGCC